jgi:hypothetical protein
MAIIGALLILLAALFIVLVLVGGSTGVVEISFGAGSLDLTATGIFLLGAATVLIFVSGLELLRIGLRRSLRRRRELKKAREVVARHDRREGDADGTEAGAPEATPAGGATESAVAGGTTPGTTTTGPATTGPPTTGTSTESTAGTQAPGSAVPGSTVPGPTMPGTAPAEPTTPAGGPENHDPGR